MKNLKRASLVSLSMAFHIDRDAASMLKDMCLCGGVDHALAYANRVLGGHGVESVEGYAYDDRYFGCIKALYVNMGDVYITTILYDVTRRQWYLTDMGTWAEKQGDKIK